MRKIRTFLTGEEGTQQTEERKSRSTFCSRGSHDGVVENLSQSASETRRRQGAHRPLAVVFYAAPGSEAFRKESDAEEIIDGAGIVKVTMSHIDRALGQAMNAPIALISSVLASSMNCSPCTSRPRMNRGIWRRIRGKRRCSLPRGTASFCWTTLFLTLMVPKY